MLSTTFIWGGTRLSLCLLLGTVLVSAEPGWKANKEYAYQISGRTVAGIPSLHNNQHVGIHYKGTLILQTYSSTLLFMKLENVTYWQIHEELPGGWWEKSSSSAQEKLWELPLSNASFAVKLNKDMVESIKVKLGLPDWEINFIQGIVSQVQFKIKGAFKRQHNFIHGKEFSFSESNSIYRIMENTMFGRCETLYQVSLVPRNVEASFPKYYPRLDVCGSKNYYEISKTRNFSNCEYQTETHFGLPETMRCDPAGSYCGDFWHRVSGSRMTGCGDKSEFILLQSETNSRVMANLHLHNASMASISSYITMHLLSMKRLEQRLQLPTMAITLTPFTYQYTSYDFTSINDFLDVESEEEASLTELPSLERGDIPFESKEVDCMDENADVSLKNADNQTIKCKLMRKNVYNVTKLPEESSTSFWHLPNFDFDYPPQQPLSPIFLHQKECPEVNSHIQQFKEIITDVASDLEDAQNIPNTMPLEKITLAVQICRTMSLSSLKKVIGKMMDTKIKTNKLLLTERKLYRDVVMMCGTGPALRIIAEWIEQYKIKGESAASLIASLPAHLQVPDAQVVQRFYELVRSKAVRDDRNLKITANLALSNFIRIACVNTKARSVRFSNIVLSSPCTLEHTERYLTWFSSQLNSDPSLKRAYIIALGNTGSYSALEKLKSVATNANNSVYLRANAVLAMKYQAFRYSEDSSRVLLSLYLDYTQPIAVRISAVSMLFYSKPQYDVWQRIALSTWYEPSSSVAAFVRTSLVSLSRLEDPVFKTMSTNARRVVLYTKPLNSGLHFSYNLVWARVSQELEEILSNQFITTNEIDASSIYYRFTQRKSQLTRIPFDGEIWLSNTDDFLSMLKQWFYLQTSPPEARPPIANLERSTRHIRESLHIKPRTMPDIEGEVHVNFDKLSERLFIFDKKYVQEMLRDLRKPMMQMRQKQQFFYQKVDQNAFEMSVVTELGFAVNFHLLAPWCIRLTGDYKLPQFPSMLETHFSFMYTTQLISHLHFYTPWDKTVYNAGSHGLTVVNIPEISMKAQLDSETQKLKLEVQTKLSEKGHVLLHHTSQPFTSHRNVGDSTPHTLTRTWQPIKVRPSQQMSKSIKLGRNFKANFNYSTELAYSSPLNWLLNSGSLYGFWMMWPSLESSSLQVEIINLPNVQLDVGMGKATARKGKVTITYDSDKRSNGAKAMSAREEDLLSQIEVLTNSSRRTRTIPSGPARPPVTDKPSVSHTTHPPTLTTTVSPAKQLLSNMLKQTAQGLVDEVMHAVKADHNLQTTPQQADIEVFDVSNINLTQAQGSSTYLLRKSLDGISNGKSQLVYMNVILSDGQESEKHENKYSLYVTHADDDTQREHNFGIFLKEDTDPSGLEISWTSTLISPQVLYLNLKDILQTQFETVLLSSLQYRLKNNYNNAVLKTNMHRSKAKMEVIKKRLEQRHCSDMINPECRTLANEAMLLDEYNVTVLYSDQDKYFGPTLEKALEILNSKIMPYTSKDQWKINTKNSSFNFMKLELNVAEDLESWNLRTETHRRTVVFKGIPANPDLMHMLLYNPSVSKLCTSTSVCGVSLKKISTYDEVLYNYNMTSNWHVLTKDASGKTRFVILARASVNDTIELEVNVDNYLVASIHTSGVTVNQKAVEIAEDETLEFKDKIGTTLLRVQNTFVPEFTASVQLPEHGMDITYNTTTVLIQAEQGMRGRLVGLCGDHNGEKIADLQTPSKTLVKSVAQFAASYSLPEVQPLSSTSELPPSSTSPSNRTVTTL